jgi:hypothetical protein
LPTGSESLSGRLRTLAEKGDVRMNIQVIYFDNTPGLVKAERLDELIRNRGIIAFRRSGGWVRVGRDPIRGNGGRYLGPDRRKKI